MNHCIKMKIKLSDYVFSFLADIGVKDVFLLPGGGCMHLLDSLGKCNDIHYYCCLHEQAAVIAAEAYGQYSNHLGVVLVTTGPGSTNAITGVASAWIDSTPLLVVSGQVKTSNLRRHTRVRQMGVQEVDIISLVKPITKYAVTVMESKKIKYHLQKAISLATTGRKGPVWIDIPLDIQGCLVETDHLIPYKTPACDFDDPVLPKKAQDTLSLLDRSERPVILVGNGVRLSNGGELFHQLIDKMKIPVLTTWKAGDLMYEEHPLYCGKPGAVGQRGANFTQQNADWIMTLGARLDLCQVAHNYANFARAARKVVVDVDAAEINKLKYCGIHVDVEVPSDVNRFMQHLMLQLEEYNLSDYAHWLARCRSWQQRYPVVASENKETTDLIDTYAFVDLLCDYLTAQDIIVPGSSGGCAEIVQQAFRLKKGQRMLNTPGLGAMGFGLPASIGACIASGRKRIISIIGDGGLQHNIQELETLARLKLPIKIFILNNGGYHSIQSMQKSHFQGRYVACHPASGLTLPDMNRVASAYGLANLRAENQNSLKAVLQQVLQSDGPMICDLKVDPDIPIAPRVASQVLPNGQIVSKPMEDLWPYLDRSEFFENMIIAPLKESKA